MAENSGSTNYYEVLDVAINAAPIEIDRAYKKARALYSPDNQESRETFEPSELKELLQMVEEAYRTLSDPMRRKAYDENRSRASASGSLGEVIDETDDYVVRKKKGAAALAPGMGKTQFSTYKVDSNMESEISSTDNFTGPLLKKIRSYKQVSLDHICDATRISRHYLIAVEEEDVKNLPAPVFVRGYVVHIAKLLGLDENKVASSYMKNLKARLEK
jgi:curved DNA-binding protein CbpA